MKKFYLSLAVLTLIVSSVALGDRASAQIETKQNGTNLVSPNLVISQFQTAGGGTTPANDEFIEIHNTSSAAVDLSGYRVVYRSSAGTNDVNFATWTVPTMVPPGGYYLIVNSSYDGATPGDFTYNSTACMCALSGTGGGLGIRFGNLNTGVLIDSVGYGTATNAFVETTVTGAPPANAGQARVSNGCQDTDNNSNDFTTLNPSVPRNSSAPVVTCGGGGNSLLANGAASPATVAPNASTLLTVAVFPAASPPSTGIGVVGNLTNIGGSLNQQFFDDGTNGDVTAGDNVFSYSALIPSNTPGGPASVPATASDAQSRSVNVTINLTIDAPIAGEDPLIFGNPSNATTNVVNENNFLMTKAQYSISYNRAKATPNWVAWRLDSTWIGTAPRQDDYRPDPALPTGWYQVQDADYSGSGYDRGHMCPSGDRTRSIQDNSATFLMTNFVPQLSANNQGPWEEFETYCRTLASQGNEIYIITGPNGNIGTIAQGRVVVPEYTWKVVLVIPNGINDVQRASSRATRAFGIVVPNFQPININAPWRNFRVTVDAVEYLTGYDFFSAIPKNTQELIERKRDKQ